MALDYYLEAHTEINKILLRLDNDEPGLKFAMKLQERYQARGYTVKSAPPHRGKDYNDYLMIQLAHLKSIGRSR